MIAGAPDVLGVQTQLLSCAYSALGAVTGVGLPQRVAVTPGPPTWDGCDCGLLTVHASRLYTSTTFPADAGGETSQRRCGNPYLAVDVTVSIVRCAPTFGVNSAPPTVEKEIEAARVLWDDAAAVLSGVACCLQTLYDARTIHEYVVRQQVVIGPEGGCVGTDTSLTVGFVNGCMCKE